MSEEKKTQIVQHNVIMEGRKDLTVSGVQDVDSFDEETVVIFTNLGELTVKGAELHITSLNLDVGEVTMQGNISSLTYNDEAEKQSGFFSRVFR